MVMKHVAAILQLVFHSYLFNGFVNENKYSDEAYTSSTAHAVPLLHEAKATLQPNSISPTNPNLNSQLLIPIPLSLIHK